MHRSTESLPPQQRSEQVGLQKIYDFATPAIDYGLHHEKTEALYLVQLNRWRQRQLLAVHHNFYESRSWVAQRLSQHGADLLRHIGLKSEDACGFRHLREVRVKKLRREVKHAGRLHFEFHEG